MADEKINVFVKLDMNGNKSLSFHIKPSTSVATLIDMIKDREGPQVADVHLMKGAKPMKVTNNAGTAMKLSDYNCYNNCTLFSSLRLIGGMAQDPNAAPAAPGGGQAEGVKARRFNTKNVIKLGGTLAVEKKAANGTILEYKNCTMYCSDGCAESGIPKAKLSCPCIFCADCMKINLDNIIKIGGGIKISCGSTSHGDHSLDEALAYEIAAFSSDEKKEKDEILSQNYFKRSDSTMSVCPNQKCRKFIHRPEGNLKVKVQCTSCQKYVCWMCKGEHLGNVWCRNEDCDPVAKINQMISLGQEKTITATHGAKKCWDTRFCPVKTCTAVNGHATACQKVKCNVCNTLYCHLCLGLWDKPGGCRYGANCEPKPKQNITKADL